MAGQGLADLLSGAAGAPVNRQGLNAFVANSQATNGLRSAQTEEALLNAQRAQDEQTAAGQLEDAFVKSGARPADAHLMAVAAKMHSGSAVNAMDMFKAYNATVLGDPSKLNTPDQTAAAQAISGKLEGPQNLPNNFSLPAGVTPPTMGQSPQGVAQTADTQSQTALRGAQKVQVGALTGLDIARAEDEHAKATNATSLSSLGPAAIDEGARVTMADPNKMSTYAGFGASGQKNKDAINNRRAQMLNDAGMTPDDMIRQRAITKASVGAAGQAAKQRQVLDAYMPLVKANGDRILQLLDQVDAAGSAGVDEPIVNGFERMLGRKLNSDDLTELHSVFTSYQAEIARLLASGPTMNGVVSDNSRELLGSMAPETMSSSGARRVINRIGIETDIRRQGVQHSLEEAAGAQLPVISTPRAAAPSGGTPPAGKGGAPAGLTLLN